MAPLMDFLLVFATTEKKVANISRASPPLIILTAANHTPAQLLHLQWLNIQYVSSLYHSNTN